MGDSTTLDDVASVEATFWDPNTGGEYKSVVLVLGEPYPLQKIDDGLCERIALRWGVTPERARKGLSAWRRLLFSPEPHLNLRTTAPCGCMDPRIERNSIVCGNCGNPFA